MTSPNSASAGLPAVTTVACATTDSSLRPNTARVTAFQWPA